MKLILIFTVSLLLSSTARIAVAGDPHNRKRHVILRGDHADPTIVRNADEFYMTHSSYSQGPGLKIWHSTNRVDWESISYTRSRSPLAEGTGLGSVASFSDTAFDGPHKLPETEPLFLLRDETAPLLNADKLPQLTDVEFHVIKKWDQPNDGYTFLHGVGLAWHNGSLFASFGHNKGAENTVTEEAHYRVSENGGTTWGPLQVIDVGEEENLAVSHGVFLSHNQTLWAFHGAYYGRMERIHTRAYQLNETTGRWKPRGVVLKRGFWPMNQPVRMDNGNWIMPGFLGKRYSSKKAFPAAVAISHGDDFTRWDLVSIPVSKSIKQMWGESCLLVDGKSVINISRYGGKAIALATKSNDLGRTWSPSVISNLPMATSKPAAGVLSNGQRYLVCTTAKNNGGKRTPLTIAVSRPNEDTFSKVFVIRRSIHRGQGESAEQLALSYPCAIERDGKLYVGYSNNGGRRANLNSAELAVIPISSLSVQNADR